MKLRDILSIISGGLITFFLWRMLYPFVESYILLAFPCSMIGGYVACRLRTHGFLSGAVSGLAAGFIITVDMAVKEGDWRSLMFGSIMTMVFAVGGYLGELIFNIIKRSDKYQ